MAFCCPCDPQTLTSQKVYGDRHVALNLDLILEEACDTSDSWIGFGSCYSSVPRYGCWLMLQTLESNTAVSSVQEVWLFLNFSIECCWFIPNLCPIMELHFPLEKAQNRKRTRNKHKSKISSTPYGMGIYVCNNIYVCIHICMQ